MSNNEMTITPVKKILFLLYNKNPYIEYYLVTFYRNIIF